MKNGDMYTPSALMIELASGCIYQFLEQSEHSWPKCHCHFAKYWNL